MPDNKHPDQAPKATPDDWDAYWAHGFLTSCANAFSGNYEGRIREAWHEYFDTLAPGDRLLDLATGNGAVALLAAEYSLANRRDFRIDGIDRARINPAAAWQGAPEVLAAVNFQGRVAAEDTPFEAGSFQAVTGQYALEYTDCDRTIEELGRIMAPGASARFVMHHPESVVIATSREEQAHGRLLFEDTQVFAHARRLLERICAAQGPAKRAALAGDSEAEAERTALNQAAARISAAIETSPEPDLLSTALGHIARAFKQAQHDNGAEALPALARGETEVATNLARLEDLLGAVVDEGKMAGIRARMNSAGIASCNPIELTFNLKNKELLMGWQLDCRREG